MGSLLNLNLKLLRCSKIACQKVKIFGRPTFGTLDISNMTYVDFPDGNYQLGICMSRSYRIPDLTIDGTGVQPDCFLDDFIRIADWVDYARPILEYQP